MTLNAREHDAVIALCQNNEARSVTISIPNGEAAEMLGYESGEALKDVDLRSLLPGKLNDIIEENVEFEEDSHDIDLVLSRMRDFAFKTKSGEELPCEIKIARLPAMDMHHHFRLVVKNERAERQQTMLLRSIHDHMAGYAIMDEALNVPNLDSLKRCMEMVLRHIAKEELTACFVMLRLDRYAKSLALYGEEGVATQLKHVINAIRQNLREDDMVFAMGEGHLGVILHNIPTEAIRVVLNRLRWYVATHRIAFGGKDDFSITISMNFKILVEDDTADYVLERCHEVMNEMDAEARGELGNSAKADEGVAAHA